MYLKYPRSFHLPWSPGLGSDDKRMNDVSGLLNVPLVITEKMDGGNVCLERNNCFARSHGQPPTHRSYDAFKGLHARVKYLIESDEQVFGEWLYAEHSIYYDNLPNYLMIIGVRNKLTGYWYEWAKVQVMAEKLGIETVPVLGYKKAKTTKDLEVITSDMVKISSLYGEKEGVVIRNSEGFADKQFTKNLGKWVRANHIMDKERHWKFKKIKKNGLKV